MSFYGKIENYVFSNIAASTGGFPLRGGAYGITVSATWGGGSVTLQRLAADGSTYVTCVTAFTANGYATVNLPPGTYRLTVATASAIYCDVVAITNVNT